MPELCLCSQKTGNRIIKQVLIGAKDISQENKLSILEISSRSDIGGGPEQLFKIIINLKVFFNFYCACPDQEPYFHKIAGEGIQVFELPCRKFELLSFFKLLRWTKTGGVTIVHSHGKGAGVYARLLKLFNRRLKVIHSFHGIHINKYSLSLFVERFLKILTDKFVFVSKSEQEIALKYGLASGAKSVLIENGIQINSNQHAVKDKSGVSHFIELPVRCTQTGAIAQHRQAQTGGKIPHNSFVIGMLSRFDRVKNIPYAVRTLSDYLKNHDDVFLIIGGDGEERENIEREIQQFNLSGKVILLGYIHNVHQFFPHIDVYLNTSLGEAFGLSTVEAMKYGKPVVASRVYGNVDVVDDNNTGILFPLNQPSLLVKGIETLKNDKVIYERLSENAQHNVKKRFDLNRMINETRELYLSFEK